MSFEQVRQMLLELVAPPLLKLLEKRGRPSGISHLVTVIKEGVRVGGMGALEGFLYMVKIIRHSALVEVVDD